VKVIGHFSVDPSLAGVTFLESKMIDGKKIWKMNMRYEISPAPKEGVLTFRVFCKDKIVGSGELQCDAY
jgi:hypothetical protein